MRHELFDHECRDGQRLQAYAWLPDAGGTGPRALIQLVHGMAEHARRYQRLAHALTKAGYTVFAHDQRGHGESAASEGELGHAADRDSFNKLIDDVREIGSAARGRFAEGSDVKVFLLGHSMGSFVAQGYAARYGTSLGGLILSATDADSGPLRYAGIALARAEIALRGARHRSTVLARMSFGEFNKPFRPSRTEFDWLSRDPNEVDAYIADRRCGFPVSAGLWADLLSGLGEIARRETRERVPKDLPVLLLTGDRDPVSQFGRGPKRLASAYRRAGVRDVTVKIYPEGRHELLNDTCRDEVTRDLLRWLEARVATITPPSRIEAGAPSPARSD